MTDEALRLSRYTLMAPLDAQARLFGLLSTLTRGMAIAPSDGLGSTPYTRLPTDTQFREVRSRLLDLSLAVPCEFDEVNQARYLLSRAAQHMDVIELTWVLTYACNLACPYCTQAGLPADRRSAVMPSHVVDSVLDWVLQAARVNRAKRFDAMLFGGEPLVAGLDPIAYVVDAMQERLSPHGSLVFGITTNGTLLCEDTAAYLLDRGCSFFQITLDGSRRIHDSQRPYKDGDGSYDRILDNLAHVAGRARICIQVNMDSAVADSMEELYADLRERDLLRHCEFNFGGILPNRTGFRGSRETPTLWEGTPPEVKGDRTGLDVRNHLLRGPCTFRRQNQVIVDPFGDLYSCYSSVGDPRFRMGNIEDPVGLDRAISARLGAQTRFRAECEGCEFLPMCWGGCAYRGSIGRAEIGFKCDRSALREAVPRAIRYQLSRHLLRNSSVAEGEGIPSRV